MIKSNNGDTKLKGSAVTLMADICVATQRLSELIQKEFQKNPKLVQAVLKSFSDGLNNAVYCGEARKWKD